MDVYKILLSGNTAYAVSGKINPSNKTDVIDVIGSLQDTLVGLAGAAAVLFVIYGGFLYITSRGNKQQAEKAKKTLTYALGGLILILLARIIYNVITKDIIGNIF